MSPRRGRRCRACSAAPSSAGVQAARPPGAGTLVREAWTPGLSRCRGPRALGRHRDPECHGQQWAAPRTGLAAQHAGVEQGGPSGPWCSGSLVLGKGSGDPVPATGHSRPLPHALLCAHGLCRRGGLLGPGPVASAVSHPAAICRRPGRAQAGPGSVPGPSCLDVGGHHVGWVPLPGGRKLSAGEGKQLAPGSRSCGGATLALDSRPGLSLSGPRRCHSHWPARLGPGPPRVHRGRGAGRSGPVERPRQRPLPSAGPSGPGTEAPGDAGLEQPRCYPAMTRPAGQSEKVPGGSTHRPRWTLRRGSCPLPFLKKIHRGPGVRHEREAAARSPTSGDEAHPLLERRSGRGGGPAGHVRPA